MARPPSWYYKANLPASLKQQLVSTDDRFYTTQKLEWQCSKLHIYTATVADRLRGRGYGFCTCVIFSSGVNDLLTMNPKLASEVSCNSPLKANEVSYKSAQKLIWKCSLNHEWKDSVSHRAAGRNCAVCSGHQVLLGFNDLSSQDAILAAQWHPTKNTSRPEEYTIKSNKKVWWLCSNDHEWKVSVCNRAAGRGCKICSNSGTSQGERVIAHYLELAGFSVQRNTKSVSKFMELDIYSPADKVAVEFCGEYWHCEVCRKMKGQHLRKAMLCERGGIKLIVVWESDFNLDPIGVLADILDLAAKDHPVPHKYTYEKERDGICCSKKPRATSSLKTALGSSAKREKAFASFLATLPSTSSRPTLSEVATLFKNHPL